MLKDCLSKILFNELNKLISSYQNKLIIQIKIKLKDNKKSKLDFFQLKQIKSSFQCRYEVEIFIFAVETELADK